MTIHQFKLKPAPGDTVYVLANADTGPAETACICINWEWAQKVARGLALDEGLDAERARRHAAALRRRTKGASK